MNNHRSLTLARIVLIGGVTAWISLIAVNNMVDSGTNKALIATMMGMKDLVADPVRGNGLESRAMGPGLAAPALWAVIVFQIVIAAALWTTVAGLVRDLVRGDGATRAATVRTGNLALSLFTSLFVGFLVCGLWFGYWMTMGPVQQVHFTLLMVAALCLVLLNLPERSEPGAPRPERSEAVKALSEV